MSPGYPGVTLAVATVLALFAVPAGATADDPDRRGAGPLEVAVPLQDSVRYASRVTDNNRVGLAVTNYGFFGNNFVSRSPSFEYPLGLGYEHMVRGGLWIGGRALSDTGEFIGVTTAAVDGGQGSSTAGATEFTPAGNNILVRSVLPNSRFFKRDAVSELDFVCSYSDIGAERFAGSQELHRPLSVLVTQETYCWSFADFAHFVILHFTITNIGRPLKDVWVGHYSELASGNKNAYSGWPPSASSGGSLGSWYDKKWLQWDEDLDLLREHYCAGPPPGECRFEVAPFWVGVKLLGVRPGSVAGKQVTLGAWDWAPGSTLRDQDVERYAIMTAGTIQDLSDPSVMPQTGDPVELLAVGPFAQVDPDSSITVDFTYVAGPEVVDIQRYAATAQLAFENNYVVPTPPPSPRLKVVPRHRELQIYWDDSPESVSDPTSPQPGGQDFEGYRVYAGEDRFAPKRIAEFDRVDTTGFNTGFAAVACDTAFPGDPVRYRYCLAVPALRDGFKYFVAVTSFDTGDNKVIPLESGISQNKTLAIPAPAPNENLGGIVVFPNPYRVEARWDAGRLVRDHYLWFANMPERARLKIFTLAGDVIFERNFDGRSYAGEGVRGIYNPVSELDVGPPTLSGATFGWDLISREGQAVASGLYLYSVEDLRSGKRQVGKFLVVKSDREGF